MDLHVFPILIPPPACVFFDVHIFLSFPAFTMIILCYWGLPGGAVVKNLICQCRKLKKCGFDSWVGRIQWSRKWSTALVFLPEKFHGQRSLVGCSL